MHAQPSPPCIVRQLGRADYSAIYQRMQTFTAERDSNTADEIWLVEHEAVFTLGTNAAENHVLTAGDIPVLRVDRGGQVTYHGPGQLVVYVLLDLQRARLGVRELVCRLERSVIATLAGWGVAAASQPGAPGVYVDVAKIASVGLRVRRHCCYHGLALNVNPDLSAFARINPCGYPGLTVTSLAELGRPVSLTTAGNRLTAALLEELQSPTRPG